MVKVSKIAKGITKTAKKVTNNVKSSVGLSGYSTVAIIIGVLLIIAVCFFVASYFKKPGEDFENIYEGFASDNPGDYIIFGPELQQPLFIKKIVKSDDGKNYYLAEDGSIVRITTDNGDGFYFNGNIDEFEIGKLDNYEKVSSKTYLVKENLNAKACPPCDCGKKDGKNVPSKPVKIDKTKKMKKTKKASDNENTSDNEAPKKTKKAKKVSDDENTSDNEAPKKTKKTKKVSDDENTSDNEAPKKTKKVSNDENTSDNEKTADSEKSEAPSDDENKSVSSD